jgi:hypothetical protein
MGMFSGEVDKPKKMRSKDCFFFTTNSLQVPARDQAALPEEQPEAVPGVPEYPVAQVAVLHVGEDVAEPSHR